MYWVLYIKYGENVWFFLVLNVGIKNSVGVVFIL